jgi:hypothetical protein
MNWIDGLPRWQRPVLNGALLVLAWFMMRGGVLLYPLAIIALAIRRDGRAVLSLLCLIPASVLAGALGGAAYSLLHPIRRVGALGVWMSWVFGMGIYLAPLLVLLDWLGETKFDPTEPAARFAWVFVSVWGGSLGYWFLGRDHIEGLDVRGPTVHGILAEAIAADLLELEQAAAKDPTRRLELAAVRSDTPSKALVMHWWRVVGRLGRTPGAGVWNLPHRWALDRAEAKLRAAQARWPRA